jgi:hypothetical protein
MINLKKTGKVFRRNFWWFVLAACLLGLLVYGLSAFTEKPTVETITTHAPTFNANNNQMRDVDFQPSRKTRRR